MSGVVINLVLLSIIAVVAYTVSADASEPDALCPLEPLVVPMPGSDRAVHVDPNLTSYEVAEGFSQELLTVVTNIVGRWHNESGHNVSVYITEQPPGCSGLTYFASTFDDGRGAAIWLNVDACNVWPDMLPVVVWHELGHCNQYYDGPDIEFEANSYAELKVKEMIESVQS